MIVFLERRLTTIVAVMKANKMRRTNLKKKRNQRLQAFQNLNWRTTTGFLQMLVNFFLISDLTISDPQLCPIKITSLGWYQYFVGWGSENLYTVYVSSPCSLLLRWLNSNKIKLFNIVLTKKFIAISKCNKDIDNSQFSWMHN